MAFFHSSGKVREFKAITNIKESDLKINRLLIEAVVHKRRGQNKREGRRSLLNLIIVGWGGGGWNYKISVNIGVMNERRAINSDVNISADFVGRFSACYGGRPRERFSGLRFGVTLTFKLIPGF